MIIKKPGDSLRRCLDNISPYVDEIILGVHPKHVKEAQRLRYPHLKIIVQPKEAFASLSEKDREYLKEFGVEPTKGYKVFKFDIARQATFDASDKESWKLWLDDDDIIDRPELIKPNIDKAISEKVKALIVNYAYELDNHGSSLADHWRTRIIAPDAGFYWKGVIHEDLLSEINPPMAQTYDFQVLHLSPQENRVANMERNAIAILKELHDAEIPDPRLIYYLGLSMQSMGRTEQAVSLMKEFVGISGWDEQRYDAHLWIGRELNKLGRPKEALNAFMDAIKEKPDYPMAYFAIAELYHDLDEHKKSIHWAEMGFKKPFPTTPLMVNPRHLDVIPLMFLADSCFNLGKINEALAAMKKVEQFYPEDADVQDELEKYQEIRDQMDVSKAFINICKYLEKIGETDRLLPLLGAIPAKLEDAPAMVELSKKVVGPKKWTENSVAIYCPFSWEEWYPGTLETGIGGSEEAVIRLSKELTKKGYNVVVYGNPGKNRGDYDGVLYLNSWEIDFDDFFNIFIGWRSPRIFSTPVCAKRKYLWLHDVHKPEEFTKGILDNLTKVIVLSKYHRNLFPTIPEKKILYSANGIDISEIDGITVERNPFKMIYTSCPSRGLEHLLDWWPDIKKAVPAAELHVYYGFGNFIKGNKNRPEKMKWVDEMMAKLNQEGITFHGRKGHGEIAKATLESGLWVYPTEFPEISCITAMKCQAYGAIPITTGYAALEETQRFGLKAPLEKLKELVITFMKDFEQKGLEYEAWNEIGRQEMIDWARKEFNWERVAEQWTKDFQDPTDYTYRYDWLIKNSEGKIVDIGGNQGITFGQDPDVTVVDIDKYDIPNFVQADASKLPFTDKSYDTAVLSEILEHVDDPVKCMKEAKRVAKKVVITVPNEYEWEEGLGAFMKLEDKKKEQGSEKFEKDVKGANPVEKFYDDDYQHLFHHRFYTKESLEEDLKKAGYENYKITDLKHGGWAWLGVVAQF